MATLTSVVQYLDSLLEPSRFKDAALNGLQVEAVNGGMVRKIAYAVDAGLSIIERAIAEEAQLLIVHHGLFWGESNLPLRGVLAKKLELLFRNRLSLYASHLPLDAHPEVGNGFTIARLLGLVDIEPFFEYGGMPVGARGKAKKEVTLESVAEKLSTLPGAISPLILPFGKDKISTVGVVTGSGSSAITHCAERGIDLLVSGEPKHEAYHLAKELGVNAIFSGHYATETVGVTALAKRLEKDFDVQTTFIDEGSGI